MRILRGGKVELCRGNIRVQVDRDVALDAVKKVKADDAEIEAAKGKRGYDAEAWIPYPDVHSPKHRFAEPWRGSGSSNGPVKQLSPGRRNVSLDDTVTVHGMTMNEGIHSLADFLAAGGTLGGSE